MTRKMYWIQVSDFRGNWVTVKQVSLKDVRLLKDEVSREHGPRLPRRIRALEADSGRVVLEIHANPDTQCSNLTTPA